MLIGQRRHTAAYLIDHRVKNFPTNQNPGDRKFTIDQPDRRVMRVLHIKARKMEIGLCGFHLDETPPWSKRLPSSISPL